MPINTPIQAQRRLASLGEIRIGEKSESGVPRSRQTFRFTSRHKNQLLKLQEAHGGELREWKAKPGTWELLSECKSLPALFSLKPMDGGDCESLVRYYEYRDKDANLMRKCDGTTCKTWENGKRVEVPCICAQGDHCCKIRGRVSVMLPDVPDFGCWSFCTSSQVFEDEAMAFIDHMQTMVPGLTVLPVLLTITRRQKETAPGQKAGFFPVVTITRDPNPKPLAQLAHEVRGQLMAPIPGSMGELPVATPVLVASTGVTHGEVVTGAIVFDPKDDGSAPVESDFDWLVSRIGQDAARDLVSAFKGADKDPDVFIESARKNDASVERIVELAQKELEGVVA